MPRRKIEEVKFNKAKFSTFVRQLRKERGMSQVELAERIGKIKGEFFSQGVVLSWENPSKTATPDWTAMAAFAEIFGLSLDVLKVFLNEDFATYEEAKRYVYQKSQARTIDVEALDSEQQIELLKKLSDALATKVEEWQSLKETFASMKLLNS
jgi:transcriptional regulator with XRE-family HTH domain